MCNEDSYFIFRFKGIKDVGEDFIVGQDYRRSNVLKGELSGFLEKKVNRDFRGKFEDIRDFFDDGL